MKITTKKNIKNTLKKKKQIEKALNEANKKLALLQAEIQQQNRQEQSESVNKKTKTDEENTNNQQQQNLKELKQLEKKVDQLEERKKTSQQREENKKVEKDRLFVGGRFARVLQPQVYQTSPASSTMIP